MAEPVGKPMRLYSERCSPGYDEKIIRATHNLWRSPSATARTLWLRCAFESRRRGFWWLEREHFPCLVVELVINGRLRYILNGKSQEVGAGEIHLTPPGAAVRTESAGSGECHRLGLELCGKALTPLLENFHLAGDETLRPLNLECFRALWQQIYDKLGERRPGSEPEISSCCFAMLSRIAEECSPTIPGLESKRLCDILNFIHSNTQWNLSCRVLAERANCSLPTLNRLFQQNLSMTPQDYISHHRMTTARDLLEIGGMTVKEIAGRLGFRNQFYFSRVFRKHFGCPPSVAAHGGRTTGEDD